MSALRTPLSLWGESIVDAAGKQVTRRGCEEIIRRVNAHDDLVAALKAECPPERGAPYIGDSWTSYDADRAWEEVETNNAKRARILAAIAKAEGRKS